ncbi:DUF3558 domain-containing protein [Actinoalloteichus caeruleus]|uniref:DUF3558 domain-containing protein n=1 Tax=Actinoalloteichus cyanogriseus TaxID=2893586 RepID=UPI0009E00F59|nr:DUF3558 domain-containing protein [Actinoalloteichus caeruleus]
MTSVSGRRWAAAPTAFVLAGAIAGCTTAEAGRSLPVEEGPTAVDTSSAHPDASDTPEDTVGEWLAAMHPCEVLSDEQLDGIGLDPATATLDDVGVIYACNYRPGPGIRPSVALNLNAHSGLDELNLTNYEPEETQVGSLRALRITDSLDIEFCQFALDLNGEANVSVMVRGIRDGGSTDEPCEMAERVATAVEPLLPR